MGTRAECCLKNIRDKGGSKMKKCLTLFAALMLLGSISVAENKSVLRLPALQRTTDTGYVRPDRDNTIDIGTSTKEFKNAYFDGTVKTDVLTVDETSTFTGDVSASADVRVAKFLGNTRINISVQSNTSIPITGTFCNLISTGADITMAVSPNISTTASSEGDYLVLTTTSTQIITITEGASQNLRLGSGTRAIGQYDSLFLVLISTGGGAGAKYWQEISFVAN